MHDNSNKTTDATSGGFLSSSVSDKDFTMPKNKFYEAWFTSREKQEFQDESGWPVTSNEKFVFAKFLKDQKGIITYYIRTGKDGDPIKREEAHNAKTRLDDMIYDIRFKKTKKKTFYQYLNYLKDNSRAAYEAAVRDMM